MWKKSFHNLLLRFLFLRITCLKEALDHIGRKQSHNKNEIQNLRFKPQSFLVRIVVAPTAGATGDCHQIEASSL
jgi:hypothetical protein